MADGQITEESVKTILNEFADPETGRPIGSTGQIGSIELDETRLSLQLGLSTHSAPLWADTVERLRRVLQEKLPQLSAISVERTVFERVPHALGEIGLRAKSVIAVGSGKGGVGKSTIAASIAFGLKRQGCSVGLMDADVYGPSIPHLLGVEGRPEAKENKIQPIFVQGMPVISMGFFVPKEEAVVWRGPMLHGAITQFLRDTDWGNLDYLIIDMPPGTGDVALTLSQLLPLSGAVIVCTPQEVALLDAVKAIAMFKTVNIPVLGLVENMSGFICPDCQKRYDIFGSGGARQRAEQMQVPFLGDVPINMQIREHGDAGSMAANFEDPQIGPQLESICVRLAAELAQRAAAQPATPSLPILG